MDYIQLQEFLNQLTERELYYQTSKTLSSKYDKYNTTVINGVKTYIFGDSGTLFELDQDFSIIKHTRFVKVPYHIHKYIEMSYVYSGTVTQRIGSETVILKKGQTCIIDTNMPHEIEETSENDIIINILMKKEYFSTTVLSRLSHGIVSNFLVNAISKTKQHDNYIIFYSEKNHKLESFFKDMLCEYYDKKLCSEEMIDSYMALIFSELLRTFQYSYHHNCPNSTSDNNLVEILRYVDKHYQTCTLETVAKHFNFHPNYLCSFIKKKTGSSLFRIIQIQKLLTASYLLRNTDRKVYEIANEVGYANLSFFYKKFKDYFGMTPQEYRDQNSN